MKRPEVGDTTFYFCICLFLLVTHPRQFLKTTVLDSVMSTSQYCPIQAFIGSFFQSPTLAWVTALVPRVQAKLLQPCLTLQPYRLWPARLLCPWDSPGKNTTVGYHAFSRGSSNPGIKPSSPVAPALQGDFFFFFYH